MDEHPGGKKILQRVGGKDATVQFWKYHNEGILKKYKAQLQIGSLEGQAAPPPKEEPKKIEEQKVVPLQAAPAAPAPAEETAKEALEAWGDLIPYGDPAWYQGYHSPYYSESHAALRQEIRAWVEEKIEPNLNEWEKAKFVPEEIYREMGTRGYLAG